MDLSSIRFVIVTSPEMAEVVGVLASAVTLSQTLAASLLLARNVYRSDREIKAIHVSF